MGDKKKHRDKSRSEQKRKSKKKNKQGKRDRDRDQQRKKKNRSRHSSSSSSSSSDNSSSQRSRQRDKKNKKKKKENQKQEKQTIAMPFSIPQTAPVIPSSITTLRPGGIVIPPPAPTAPVVVASTKPKTKQSHIFKLLPKLPIGCITIGRTIYSSSLFSQGFQSKIVNSVCEQLQKAARAEGSKKMASMMSKVKAQINQLQLKRKQQDTTITQQKEKQFQNQFNVLNKTYNNQIRNLRQKSLTRYNSRQKLIL